MKFKDVSLGCFVHNIIRWEKNNNNHNKKKQEPNRNKLTKNNQNQNETTTTKNLIANLDGGVESSDRSLKAS